MEKYFQLSKAQISIINEIETMILINSNWNVPHDYLVKEIQLVLQIFKKELHKKNFTMCFDFELINNLILLFFLHDDLINIQTYVGSLAILRLYFHQKDQEEYFNDFLYNNLLIDWKNCDIKDKIEQTYSILLNDLKVENTGINMKEETIQLSHDIEFPLAKKIDANIIDKELFSIGTSIEKENEEIITEISIAKRVHSIEFINPSTYNSPLKLKKTEGD